MFFDIITNHTADVIDYEEGQYSYRDKATYPYVDADGIEFDDRDYAGTDTFPPLDLDSFPYSPVFRTTADETVKSPAWLNNPIYYHNRGDSSFVGENSNYGDFFGLDDLFTEQPAVVDGMTAIYKTWVTDVGIDGYRIDTAKHVNIEFWQEFSPELQAHAATLGNDDFFMFGEVFDSNPQFMSTYTTEGKLQATLDFGFQARAQAFAAFSSPTDELRDLFALDDWYTDADSNAYSLPTFLGNHDIGRIGRFVATANPGASDAELLARDELAHTLMYLVRGMPVVYYGDEQGFTGDGGDKDARQDMMPSLVASYNDDDLIGTAATTADANFDETHPIYAELSALAALKAANPALQHGAQVHRYSTGAAGIYAFSRIDPVEGIEYVVALNNSETAKTQAIQTYGAASFTGIWPARRRHADDEWLRAAESDRAATVGGRVQGRRCAWVRYLCAGCHDRGARRRFGCDRSRRDRRDVVRSRVRRGHVRGQGRRRDRLDAQSAPTTTRRTASTSTLDRSQPARRSSSRRSSSTHPATSSPTPARPWSARSSHRAVAAARRTTRWSTTCDPAATTTAGASISGVTSTRRWTGRTPSRSTARTTMVRSPGSSCSRMPRASASSRTWATQRIPAPIGSSTRRRTRRSGSSRAT